MAFAIDSTEAIPAYCDLLYMICVKNVLSMIKIIHLTNY